MEISTFLIYFFLILSLSFLYTIQGFEPSPAPSFFSSLAPESASSHSLAPNSGGTLAPTSDPSPPSPTLSFPPSLAPAPMTVENGGEADVAPAPEMEGSESFKGIGPSSTQEAEEPGVQMVKWCTLRQEYEACQLLVSVFDQSNYYTWKCIQKDTAQECLESIKRGEADLMNLEAGLAYTAFINYSMKAIANEVYCDHAKSYQAVAVFNRKACKENKGISLMDFEGHKSCHGRYSTAAGWNYPINHIKESLDSSQKMNDREIATGFFSKICAPSEFEGSGICSGCGNENGSCPLNSPYFGDPGAFRCLMEELGDIAFVKADTVLLYSMEGPHNQSWSSKSIRDFMYLCPEGGCREINDYPGSCSFGAVPANAIMASNSLPNKKRLFILQTLTNATLFEVLAGRYGSSPLLSPSTQEIDVVKKLTRSYLGISASISQKFYTPNNQTAPSTANPVSDVPSQSCSWGQNSPVFTLFSVLSMLWLLVFIHI